MKKILGILLACYSCIASAQTAQIASDTIPSDSIKTVEKDFTFSIGAYMDAYYGYDFAEPSNRIHPYFVSSTHHNQFATNIMMLDVQVQHPNVRVWLRPAFGTYMESNYALEPPAFRNFTEAFAGVCLSVKRQIWLDAGIIFCPIAFENPYSRDQIMYTRSLTVENVPYYVTGLRLTAPVNDKLTVYGYLVNGWQQIVDFNQHKSILAQVEYKPTKQLLVNWDFWMGREDSPYHPNFRMRYFSDIFITYDISNKFSLLAVAYAGTQKVVDPVNNAKRVNYNWQSANIAARWYFGRKLSLSARAEIFNDPNNVMLAPQNTAYHRFLMYGASLCFNYKISDYALMRAEGRSMYSDRPIYEDHLGFSKHNYFLVASITAWFTKEWKK